VAPWLQTHATVHPAKSRGFDPATMQWYLIPPEKIEDNQPDHNFLRHALSA